MSSLPPSSPAAGDEPAPATLPPAGSPDTTAPDAAAQASPAPEAAPAPAGGMDLRTYGIGAQILADLGVHAMELLTPTHSNIVGLEGYGLSVVAERPIPGEAE